MIRSWVEHGGNMALDCWKLEAGLALQASCLSYKPTLSTLHCQHSSYCNALIARLLSFLHLELVEVHRKSLHHSSLMLMKYFLPHSSRQGHGNNLAQTFGGRIVAAWHLSVCSYILTWSESGKTRIVSVVL